MIPPESDVFLFAQPLSPRSVSVRE
jgi:hypothetical protein